MSEFVDGLGLSFEHFVKLAKTRWISSSSISFVKPHLSHSVILSGRAAQEVPEEFHKQFFDDSYLRPIAFDLGISLNKTAELLALRNAWIAYIKGTAISNLSFDKIRSMLTTDFAASYLVLTSNKWYGHPWMQAQINQPDIQEINANSPHPLDDSDAQAHYHTWMESQLNDINYCINMFNSQKDAFTSFLEVDADAAMHDIKRAKKRIAELHTEVETQESIISEAMRPIRKLKKAEKTSINKLPGRPKETEEQKERSDIAKRFVAQWVNSLMDALSISSCGELAKVVGGQKMTWWRWKNEETLPPLKHLRPLLNTFIKRGEHNGTKVCDIKTTPSLNDLVELVALV